MLLDSNIIIYAAKQNIPEIDALVISAGSAVASATQIEVYGYPGLSPHEEAALDVLFRRFTVHALDDAVVQRTILLRRQNKMRIADAIIAATALVHGLTLVTRNTADFKRVPGLQLIDPLTKAME